MFLWNQARAVQVKTAEQASRQQLRLGTSSGTRLSEKSATDVKKMRVSRSRAKSQISSNNIRQRAGTSDLSDYGMTGGSQQPATTAVNFKPFDKTSRFRGLHVGGSLLNFFSPEAQRMQVANMAMPDKASSALQLARKSSAQAVTADQVKIVRTEKVTLPTRKTTGMNQTPQTINTMAGESAPQTPDGGTLSHNTRAQPAASTNTQQFFSRRRTVGKQGDHIKKSSGAARTRSPAVQATVLGEPLQTQMTPHEKLPLVDMSQKGELPNHEPDRPDSDSPMQHFDDADASPSYADGGDNADTPPAHRSSSRQAGASMDTNHASTVGGRPDVVPMLNMDTLKQPRGASRDSFRRASVGQIDTANNNIVVEQRQPITGLISIMMQAKMEKMPGESSVLGRSQEFNNTDASAGKRNVIEQARGGRPVKRVVRKKKAPSPSKEQLLSDDSMPASAQLSAIGIAKQQTSHGGDHLHGSPLIESCREMPRAPAKQSSGAGKPIDIKPSKSEQVHWRKSPTMHVQAMVAHPNKALVENVYIAERKYLIHLGSGAEKNFEKIRQQLNQTYGGFGADGVYYHGPACGDQRARTMFDSSFMLSLDSQQPHSQPRGASDQAFGSATRQTEPNRRRFKGKLTRKKKEFNNTVVSGTTRPTVQASSQSPNMAHNSVKVPSRRQNIVKNMNITQMIENQQRRLEKLKQGFLAAQSGQMQPMQQAQSRDDDQGKMTAGKRLKRLSHERASSHHFQEQFKKLSRPMTKTTDFRRASAGWDVTSGGHEVTPGRRNMREQHQMLKENRNLSQRDVGSDRSAQGTAASNFNRAFVYGRKLASTRNSADGAQLITPVTPVALVPHTAAQQPALQKEPSVSERVVYHTPHGRQEDNIRIGTVLLQRSAAGGVTVSSADKMYGRDEDTPVMGPVGQQVGSASRSKQKEIVQASDYGYSKPKMKISSGVLAASRVFNPSSPKDGLRRSEESQKSAFMKRSPKTAADSPRLPGGKRTPLERMAADAPSGERYPSRQGTSALEDMMHFVQQQQNSRRRSDRKHVSYAHNNSFNSQRTGKSQLTTIRNESDHQAQLQSTDKRLTSVPATQYSQNFAPGDGNQRYKATSDARAETALASGAATSHGPANQGDTAQQAQVSTAEKPVSALTPAYSPQSNDLGPDAGLDLNQRQDMWELQPIKTVVPTIEGIRVSSGVRRHSFDRSKRRSSKDKSQLKKVVRVSSRRKSVGRNSRTNHRNSSASNSVDDSYNGARIATRSNGKVAEDSSFEIRIDLEKERMLARQMQLAHEAGSAVPSCRDGDVNPLSAEKCARIERNFASNHNDIQRILVKSAMEVDVRSQGRAKSDSPDAGRSGMTASQMSMNAAACRSRRTHGVHVNYRDIVREVLKKSDRRRSSIAVAGSTFTHEGRRNSAAVKTDPNSRGLITGVVADAIDNQRASSRLNNMPGTLDQNSRNRIQARSDKDLVRFIDIRENEVGSGGKQETEKTSIKGKHSAHERHAGGDYTGLMSDSRSRCLMAQNLASNEKDNSPLYLVVGEGSENVYLAGSHATEALLVAQEHPLSQLQLHSAKELTADVSVTSGLELLKMQEKVNQITKDHNDRPSNTDLNTEGLPSPSAARRVGSSCFNRRSSHHQSLTQQDNMAAKRRGDRTENPQQRLQTAVGANAAGQQNGLLGIDHILVQAQAQASENMQTLKLESNLSQKSRFGINSRQRSRETQRRLAAALSTPHGNTDLEGTPQASSTAGKVAGFRIESQHSGNLKHIPFIQEQVIRSQEGTFTTEAARVARRKSRDELKLREQSTVYGQQPNFVGTGELVDDPDVQPSGHQIEAAPNLTANASSLIILSEHGDQSVLRLEQAQEIASEIAKGQLPDSVSCLLDSRALNRIQNLKTLEQVRQMQDDIEQVRQSLMRASATGTEMGADSPGIRALAARALGSVRLSNEGNASVAYSAGDNHSQDNLISRAALHSQREVDKMRPHLKTQGVGPTRRPSKLNSVVPSISGSFTDAQLQQFSVLGHAAAMHAHEPAVDAVSLEAISDKSLVFKMQCMKQCATNLELLQIKEQEIRRRLIEERQKKVEAAARREEALSQQRTQELIAGGRLKEGLKVSEYKFSEDPIYQLESKGARTRAFTPMTSNVSPAAQRPVGQGSVMSSRHTQRRRLMRSQQGVYRKQRSLYGSQMSVAPVRGEAPMAGGEFTPKVNQNDNQGMSNSFMAPSHYQISELIAARRQNMKVVNNASISEPPSLRSSLHQAHTQGGTEIITQRVAPASDVSPSPIAPDVAGRISPNAERILQAVNTDIWGDVVGASGQGTETDGATKEFTMSANQLIQTNVIETNLAALNLQHRFQQYQLSQKYKQSGQSAAGVSIYDMMRASNPVIAGSPNHGRVKQINRVNHGSMKPSIDSDRAPVPIAIPLEGDMPFFTKTMVEHVNVEKDRSPQEKGTNARRGSSSLVRDSDNPFQSIDDRVFEFFPFASGKYNDDQGGDAPATNRYSTQTPGGFGGKSAERATEQTGGRGTPANRDQVISKDKGIQAEIQRPSPLATRDDEPIVTQYRERDFKSWCRQNHRPLKQPVVIQPVLSKYKRGSAAASTNTAPPPTAFATPSDVPTMMSQINQQQARQSGVNTQNRTSYEMGGSAGNASEFGAMSSGGHLLVTKHLNDDDVVNQ